jgi:hypothetical protein
MTDTFQKTINQYLAPAVEGDFASANPRATLLAGEGALVAGSLGVIVGRFAWAAAGVAKSFWQASSQIGFIHRDAQALITAWLDGDSLTIPAGMGVTAFTQGDFWGRFAGGATIGQKVYANYLDGSLSAAATATAPTNTFTFNSATSTTITVTAVNTGMVLGVGQPVSGTDIPAGAYITALGTGAGGAGTYTISAAATGTHTGSTGTASTGVETGFTVRSTAAAGELAKISSWG